VVGPDRQTVVQITSLLRHCGDMYLGSALADALANFHVCSDDGCGIKTKFPHSRQPGAIGAQKRRGGSA